MSAHRFIDLGDDRYTRSRPHPMIDPEIRNDHLATALGSPSFRGRRVVVDAGNGAAYRVAPRALEQLGATVDVCHVEPDGENINAE